jgi:hypothetical protein
LLVAQDVYDYVFVPPPQCTHRRGWLVAAPGPLGARRSYVLVADLGLLLRVHGRKSPGVRFIRSSGVRRVTRLLGSWTFHVTLRSLGGFPRVHWSLLAHILSPFGGSCAVAAQGWKTARTHPSILFLNMS